MNADMYHVSQTVVESVAIAAAALVSILALLRLGRRASRHPGDGARNTED
jgi:hypothetical protein